MKVSDTSRFWSITPKGIPGLDGVWRHRAAIGEAEAERHFVAPDGCADLIACFSDGGLQTVMLQQPTLSAEVVSIAPHHALFGVRFRLGVGGALLRNRAELEHRVAAFLANADPHDVDRVSARLASYAAELVQQQALDPPLWLIEALDEAQRRWGNVSVAELARRVGVSERSLHRGCLAWAGAAPKPLLRVMRVRRAASLVAAATPLAELAADLGFADQAHLSREMRELWGTTPAALRASDFFKTGVAAAP